MKGLPFSTIMAGFVIWGTIYACQVVTANAQAATLPEDKEIFPSNASPRSICGDDWAPLPVQQLCGSCVCEITQPRTVSLCARQSLLGLWGAS